MAAPIIFFPALITNAVSILTLPKISKEQSLCNYKKIKMRLNIERDSNIKGIVVNIN